MFNVHFLYGRSASNLTASVASVINKVISNIIISNSMLYICLFINLIIICISYWIKLRISTKIRCFIIISKSSMLGAFPLRGLASKLRVSEFTPYINYIIYNIIIYYYSLLFIINIII